VAPKPKLVINRVTFHSYKNNGVPQRRNISEALGMETFQEVDLFGSIMHEKPELVSLPSPDIIDIFNQEAQK